METCADGPVTVGRYEWVMEASLAQSRLAAAGIPSWIPESCFGSIYWHYAKAIGGIRLQVRSEDAEDAAAILDEPPIEIEEPIVSGTEALADRALRATVFGFVAQFPVLLYGCWLVVRLLAGVERLNGDTRRKAISAVVLLALLLVPWLAFVAWRVGSALQ